MQPQVMLYEEKRKKWDNEKKAFKQSNGRSMPYPNHLKENMSNICPNDSGITPLEKRMHFT